MMLPTKLSDSVSGATITQNEIKSRYSEWTQGGAFEVAFPNLARAVRGKEYLPLDEALKVLESEETKEDVFEIMEMKFPISEVTGWGIVLILSVQLYFVTYLRQLTRKNLARIRLRGTCRGLVWTILD